MPCAQFHRRGHSPVRVVRSSTSTSRGSRGSGLLLTIVVMLSIDLMLHRGDKEPTPGRALVESLVWVACGLELRRRRVGDVGRRRVRRVPLRLPDREVAVGRQRVRVGGDLLDVRDPAAVPAPRAVLGRVRRARAARDLHRGRRRAHRPVLVVAARVRRVPRVHGDQGAAAPRRRRRARPRPRGRVPPSGSCRCRPSSTVTTSSPR